MAPTSMEIVNADYNLQIATDGELWAHDADMVAFLAALHGLDAGLPLATFLVKQKVADPEKYRYEFTTQDGRTWKSVLTISQASAIEPSMTFDVPTPFTLSEFEPHRELRARVIALVQKRQLTLIDGTFAAP